MNRRAFIQGLIGLASMPAIGKYINIFRPSAVREGITQAADNTFQKGIEFYEAVIKRVIDEGTIVSESDRIRTYKHPDKPEIDVEINVGTGDTSVNFESDYGFRAGAEITTDIEAGPASKELMEGELVYRGHGPEGDYSKDWEEGIIEGGITNLEEWIKMKRGYAAGGRVGMWKGGMPRGLMAALKTIRGKFGKGAIHQADEVVIDGKIYKYDDPNRPATELEIETKYDELNDPEAGLPGYTVKELDQALIDAQEYEAAMFADYKAAGGSKRAGGPKDPIKDAIENASPGYTGDLKYDAQILADDLAEQRFGKEFDDLTQRQQLDLYDEAYRALSENRATYIKNKNLSKPTKTLESMKAGQGINMSDPVIAEEFARFMKETDPKGHRKIEEIVELSNFDPKGRKKNAKGGRVDDTEVNLTVIKIPDISGSGVETLFERR